MKDGEPKIIMSEKRFKELAAKGASVLSLAALATATGCSVNTVDAHIPTEAPESTIEPFPSPSPEFVLAIEKTAQETIDAQFEGLGIHDPRLIGDVLADASGQNRFAFFESQLPNKQTNEDMNFLVIAGVGEENKIESVRELVVSEAYPQEGDILTFASATFDARTQIFEIQDPYLRTNTQTGEIEITTDGMTWVPLLASPYTYNEVRARVGGGGVLAARALPIPTIEPSPESFTNNRSVLEREGFRIESEEGPWRLVTGDEENPTEVAVAPDSQTISIRTVNGQELTFPQEEFTPRGVDGIDTKLILTLENEQNEVEYFYLEGQGWVTPIEIQTNPENREEYTQITPEDVWSGRLLYSELLVAQPFPEGTLVPDGFFYYGRWLPVGYRVVLSSFLDTEGLGWTDVVNENNVFRRWVGFYKTETPEGVEIIIATEQFLSVNGQDSLFFHYAFGPYWDNTGDIFAETGDQRYWLGSWVYYVDELGREDCRGLFGANRVENGGTECAFYENPQNYPFQLFPKEVKENIENRQNFSGPNHILGEAGEELEDFQKMILLPRSL